MSKMKTWSISMLPQFNFCLYFQPGLRAPLAEWKSIFYGKETFLFCQAHNFLALFFNSEVANQNWKLKIPNPVLVKAWVGKWKCESTIEAAQSGLDLRPVHNSQLDHKVKVVLIFCKNIPLELSLDSCNKMSRTLLLRLPYLFTLIELLDISTPF